MPLPRPASPHALWADLRAFWSTRPRHQWVAALLALLIPAGIVTAFYFDTTSGIMPREELLYIDSWPATRTDAQIMAKQKADAAALKAARLQRQREFQRIEDGMNRMGL
jgi:hypothetical protein